MRSTRRLLLPLPAVFLAACLALAPATGCSKPAAPSHGGTIVSLSPAATDLLVAMGLADKIVGVSPFEANDDLRKKLPKVGDYERIDWERMAAIRPQFLVVQGKRDRLPPGVRETATAMNVTTVILQIDRLADIRAAVLQLGRETNNADAAAKLDADLAGREAALAGAAKRINTATTIPAARPAVPTLIALGENGTFVVGGETYLDDALTLAGGSNVMTTKGYFAIDAEKFASLRPRVVFLLLPASDAATVRRATSAMRRAGLSNDATIIPLTEKEVLMPGTAAYTLAEAMASHLRALP